jgi:alkanesulfonate monooxygenase SsuD/methylene tetrahydromethanopterin reductase-like flavin-dependent oxidoreductase (luciferase family)
MNAGADAARVRVGISVVPATAELDRIRELVRTADDVGLDAVGIQDHATSHRDTA